ncbi:hypothetical protein GCM10027440_55160 [Nocardiopsis coralliicola]
MPVTAGPPKGPAAENGAGAGLAAVLEGRGATATAPRAKAPPPGGTSRGAGRPRSGAARLRRRTGPPRCRDAHRTPPEAGRSGWQPGTDPEDPRGGAGVPPYPRGGIRGPAARRSE